MGFFDIFKQGESDTGFQFFKSGTLKISQNDFEGGIADLNIYLKTNKANDEAFFNRGLAKNKLGLDFKGAVNDFTKAIEINPDDKDYYYNRGLALLALTKVKNAISDFTKTIELDSKDNYAFSSRADAKMVLNDLTGAISDYSLAIQLCPNCISNYLSRCVCKRKLDDFEGALKDCEIYISHNNDNPKAYFYISDCKFELKDYKGSIDAILTAIKLEPNNKHFLKQKEIVQMVLDKASEIVNDEDKLKPIIDSKIKGLLKSGYDKLDADLKGSLLDFKQALDYDRNSPKLHFLVGDTNFKLGDFDAALTNFTDSIELSVNYSDPYEARGDCYLELDELVLAEKDYIQVINIDSNNIKVLFNLATINYKKGDFEQSIKYFSDIILLDPDNKDAYYYRGISYSNIKIDYKCGKDMAYLSKLGDMRGIDFLKERYHS